MKALCFLLVLTMLAGCKRERRDLHVDAASAQPANGTQVGDLLPGPAQPSSDVSNSYEENAYALSEGKRLYSQFNCVGCHAHGGGGMGPALMDAKWIYGSKPEQIYATIAQGRPNGMPAFRGKIADYQVWQLVAYVRSLGALTSSGPAPGRDDDMSTQLPENTRDRQTPVNSSLPP
jgi:cytochrome c oxidase cbb3-type subunit 3